MMDLPLLFLESVMSRYYTGPLLMEERPGKSLTSFRISGSSEFSNLAPVSKIMNLG